MLGSTLTCYCGNLNHCVSSTDLADLFSHFGAVDRAQVITESDTGRSKGFGFVEMKSDNEALAAIRALNQKEHQGRRLAVFEARPSKSHGRRGRSGHSANGSEVDMVGVRSDSIYQSCSISDSGEPTIVLSGDVRSRQESDGAERMAWANPGVTHVENLITVTPWGSGPAEEWGY